MKAYKIELLIIDFDNIGEEAIVGEIEHTKYSNDCLHPNVKRIESRDIGEWHDDHPLNKKDSCEQEYLKLFN